MTRWGIKNTTCAVISAFICVSGSPNSADALSILASIDSFFIGWNRHGGKMKRRRLEKQ